MSQRAVIEAIKSGNRRVASTWLRDQKSPVADAIADLIEGKTKRPAHRPKAAALAIVARDLKHDIEASGLRGRQAEIVATLNVRNPMERAKERLRKIGLNDPAKPAMEARELDKELTDRQLKRAMEFRRKIKPRT